MKCSLCYEVRELTHWIYMKNSWGKKIKGAEIRVCELCYQDSLK